LAGVGRITDRQVLDRGIRAPRAIIDGVERSASVSVRHGTIVAIDDFAVVPLASDVVTLSDDVVLIPGLVDTHVHINEPGRTEWEGFESATAAAAAAGVLTIIDMPLILCRRR
jgi:allantoinase